MTDKDTLFDCILNTQLQIDDMKDHLPEITDAEFDEYCALWDLLGILYEEASCQKK